MREPSVVIALLDVVQALGYAGIVLGLVLLARAAS